MNEQITTAIIEAYKAEPIPHGKHLTLLGERYDIPTHQVSKILKAAGLYTTEAHYEYIAQQRAMKKHNKQHRCELTLPTGECVTTYKEYLSSNYWKNWRDNYLKTHRDIVCPICHDTRKGRGSHKVLHHLNYQHLGCETQDDVIIMCWKCHSDMHDYAHTNKHSKTDINGWLECDWHTVINLLEGERRERETQLSILNPFIEQVNQLDTDKAMTYMQTFLETHNLSKDELYHLLSRHDLLKKIR